MIWHNLTIGLLSSFVVSSAAHRDAAPTTREAVAPNNVTVTTTDYRFAMPDTLTAGPTTFTLVNRGREAHHLFLVRLKNGKTIADLGAAMSKPGPMPAWAVAAGGPNAVDPGSSSLATTVNLRAGHYAAICIVPGPDGAPHIAKGMVHDLIVRPGSSTAATAPAPTATISLYDYGFKPSTPLRAGNHVVLVRNDGKQVHELVLTKLLPGKTPGDIASWVEKMAGPPPAHFLGGVSPIAPGHSNTLSLDLTPGHYVFLCFVPDAKDGKPHVAHGMVSDFVVN
jgi:uncharacterized cupredoxin-like copper-binding protein